MNSVKLKIVTAVTFLVFLSSLFIFTNSSRSATRHPGLSVLPKVLDTVATAPSLQRVLDITRWRIQDQIRRRKNMVPWPEADQFNEEQTPVINMVPDPEGQRLEAIWQAEWEKNLLDKATEKVKRQLDPRKFQIFDCLVNKEWPPGTVAKVFSIPIARVYRTKYTVAELIKEEIRHLDDGLL